MWDEYEPPTLAEWWQDVVEDLPPARRHSAEHAAATVTGAGCPPSVWMAALRDLQRKLHIPSQQWQKYAATYRQVANLIDGRKLKGSAHFDCAEEAHGWALDTRLILRATDGDDVSAFDKELPPLQDRLELVVALRAYATACTRAAKIRQGQRSAGVPEARSRAVAEILRYTGSQHLTPAIAVLLAVVTDAPVTADSLNMARSRRGERTPKPTIVKKSKHRLKAAMSQHGRSESAKKYRDDNLSIRRKT